MRKILIAIFFVSLLISNLANAEGKGTVFGLGLKTCGWVLSNKDEKLDKLLLLTYIGGHFTGANLILDMRDMIMIESEMNVLYHLALKKCRDNPKDRFDFALERVLIDELMSTKK